MKGDKENAPINSERRKRSDASTSNLVDDVTVDYKAKMKAMSPEAQLEYLEKELSNRDVTLRAIQRNFETISKQRTEETTRHAERKEALDRMSEKFHETDRFLMKERSKVKELEQKVATLEKLTADLKERLQNRTDELDKFRSSTDGDRRKFNEMNATMVGVTRELKEKSAALEDLRRVVKKLEAQLKDESDKGADAAAKLGSAMAAMDSLVGVEEQLKEERKDFEIKMSSLKRLVTKLEAEANAKDSIQRKEIDDLNAAAHEQFSEMREMRDVNARALMDERKRHGELKEKAAALMHEVSRLERETENLTHTNTMAEHRIQQLEAQLKGVLARRHRHHHHHMHARAGMHA